jgi:hypothetical protein
MMRNFLRYLFTLFAFLALGASILNPLGSLTFPLQIIALVLLVLVVLDRVFNVFKPGRGQRIPPSQVAEIERLYFRSMREMLNDSPNLVQVISDLQRITSIDDHYKNARHYLTRAIALQQRAEVDPSAQNGSRGGHTRHDFQMLQEQLVDPDPAVRKAVVMDLIQYGERAVDPLIALLMDEDNDVRVHAATALGWVGGTDAVQPLLVALKDENPYVRRYAARALCWVVNEDAMDGLIDALGDDDHYVRRYAARAMGWSQDMRAIRPLVELLHVEQNNDVRDYALTALADLGERDLRVERPISAQEG